jgi:hypothetical protein
MAFSRLHPLEFSSTQAPGDELFTVLLSVEPVRERELSGRGEQLQVRLQQFRIHG